uniref:Uncharacterized protein n=1 Tax=Panagrolaimus davidi TaxID=227884 RepID=A0A914Q656_9BILA
MSLISVAGGFLELNAFALGYFNYINHISSLCNPITLLIVCKFIRLDFIAFISGIKPKPVAVAPWSSPGAGSL